MPLPPTPTFVYGAQLPGGADGAWLNGVRGVPATVRGSLWRGPRRHPVLVPDPDGDRVAGLLVALDPAHRAVLTLIDGDPVGKHDASGARWGPERFAPRWTPIVALAGLRAVPAEVWALPSTYAAQLAGYRPTRAAPGTRP